MLMSKRNPFRDLLHILFLFLLPKVPLDTCPHLQHLERWWPGLLARQREVALGPLSQQTRPCRGGARGGHGRTLPPVPWQSAWGESPPRVPGVHIVSRCRLSTSCFILVRISGNTDMRLMGSPCKMRKLLYRTHKSTRFSTDK